MVCLPSAIGRAEGETATVHLAAPTPETAPLATWLAGEGTRYPSPSSAVYDSTDDGHDGLMTGATWVTGDSADLQDSGGEALTFDGGGSYVDVSTAVDLALSRTISLQFDVSFTANPAAGTEEILRKDGSAVAYAVDIKPKTGATCPAGTCAAVSLLWGSRWVTSKPVVWDTATWYTVSVVDNGSTVTFSRGPSSTKLSSLGSAADPTHGAGTNATSGSLYLGGGEPGGGSPLIGSLQDVRLGVPLTVAPTVSKVKLAYTRAPIGTPLSLTADIAGSWANPDDPYLPQPDIYDELHGVTPVATDLDDPGSVTATALITPPDSTTTVSVPGFLYQNFTVSSAGLAPSGPPVWTFRYTPEIAGSFTVTVTVTTFDGTSASTATSASVAFAVTSKLAKGYKGFVQINRTSGDNPRYYQYSQTGQTFFANGANLDVPEFGDASHGSALRGMFGGDPGVERTVDGQPEAGIGEKDGIGATAQTLAGVYQRYMSDISNLAAQGANMGRIRLDSRFLPLELCPAGEWTTSCSTDLTETYSPRSPSHQAGLTGFPNGVLPPPSAVFPGSGGTPDYFTTFAVGRYNDANAWIADQIVKEGNLDGMAFQLVSWNVDLDYGSTCYAIGGVFPNRCAPWIGKVSQDLVVRRLYYDEARWGYSPSISAWELVNEYPSRVDQNLPAFWTGATVTSANGTKTFVPGIIDWLRAYNVIGDIDEDSHIITTSCSTDMPAPQCDPIDQVEIHNYQSLTPKATAIQSAFQEPNFACNPTQPCQWAEYGMSNNIPADPNNWVALKGVWSALATNHSGAWFWYTEEDLDTKTNTPPYTAVPGYQQLSNDTAPWDQWTGSTNSNPYSIIGAVSTFLSSWPGTGPGDPDGLDSYAWSPATVTGPEVTGPSPTVAGLSAQGMVGVSSSGGVTSLVWLLNDVSLGSDPTTGDYATVPAGPVTVSCSSCDAFTPGDTYSIEYWDTNTGTVLSNLTTTAVATSDGVTFDAPAIATDVAVTIAPVS